MNTSYVEHTFGPGETIRAIIRKKNHEAMTPQMLTILMNQYNELNGAEVPKLGEQVKIPIFIGFKGGE